jgi:hypothetical protein
MPSGKPLPIDFEQFHHNSFSIRQKQSIPENLYPSCTD